jgi:predicted nucleic acid-binding protein
VILDTSFLKDLKDGDENALAHARRIEEMGVPLRIPTIVSFEWYYGVQYVPNPIEDQRRFQQLAANKTFQAITDPIARKAGTLNATHEQSDTKPSLGTRDSIVAATGLQLSKPVVTTDLDFKSVDGLDVSMP